YIVLLGFGRHAVSASDLADFNATIRDTVIGEKFVQSSADAGPHVGVIAGSVAEKRVPYELNDLIQRDRRFRRVDDSFEFGLKAERTIFGRMPPLVVFVHLANSKCLFVYLN